jgi:4'-phosphopantetheinyl transferase
VVAPGWLTQQLADLPVGDDWLGERELTVLEDLRLAPRRATWRLGRWTAKRALASRLCIPLAAIEVLAAHDGAPEAFAHGRPIEVSLSISHRGERALAVVAEAPARIGCDLEIVEPRSAPFVREWLAPEERRLLAAAGSARAPLLANLMWTGKEAAAKLWREGLRLDLRRAVVRPAEEQLAPDGWAALEVGLGGYGPPVHGWWRSDAEWVMSVVGDPAPGPPEKLD